MYGGYFALLNLVLVFQVFLDLGIENYTRKEIGRSSAKITSILPGVFFLKVILSVLFTIVLFAVGILILDSAYERKLLIILLINQTIASFILYLRANIGGLQLFKYESVLSVTDRFLMILICGGLLLAPITKNSFKIEWFVLAQTISYIITLILSLVVILRKVKPRLLHFSIKDYLPILKRLWPFTLLTLLMAFYYRIDSVFLRFLLDDGQVQAGIYAHGFRILDFMSNYALIFSFILLPTFAKMIARRENIAPLFKLSVLALVVPSISLLSGVFFYRAKVFEVLYSEHANISSDVFGIMIISFLAVCVNYTFGALLTARGCLKQLNIMAFIAVILSICLNLLLIPIHKVIGAAIANGIVQIFTIVFHIVLVTKKFKLKPDWLLILKVILFVIVSLMAGYIVSGVINNWFAGVIVVFTLSILFALFVKLLRISYIRELLKSPG